MGRDQKRSWEQDKEIETRIWVKVQFYGTNEDSKLRNKINTLMILIISFEELPSPKKKQRKVK